MRRGVHVSYYYVASALDGLKESTNSAETTAMLLAAPVAPTRLKASIPKGPRRVTLTWKQSTSPEIAFNRVYRSTNGGAYSQIAELNYGTSYVDSSVGRKMINKYFVTAVNIDHQESPASNTVLVQLR